MKKKDVVRILDSVFLLMNPPGTRQQQPVAADTGGRVKTPVMRGKPTSLFRGILHVV
jgi:hypothetical protein